MFLPEDKEAGKEPGKEAEDEQGHEDATHEPTVATP